MFSWRKVGTPFSEAALPWPSPLLSEEECMPFPAVPVRSGRVMSLGSISPSEWPFWKAEDAGFLRAVRYTLPWGAEAAGTLEAAYLPYAS